MFKWMVGLTLMAVMQAQAQDVSAICAKGKKSKRLNVLCHKWRQHDRNNFGFVVGGGNRNDCAVGSSNGVRVDAKLNYTLRSKCGQSTKDLK